MALEAQLTEKDNALAATLPKLAPADVSGLTAWLKTCPAPTSEVPAC